MPLVPKQFVNSSATESESPRTRRTVGLGRQEGWAGYGRRTGRRKEKRGLHEGKPSIFRVSPFLLSFLFLIKSIPVLKNLFPLHINPLRGNQHWHLYVSPCPSTRTISGNSGQEPSSLPTPCLLEQSLIFLTRFPVLKSLCILSCTARPPTENPISP